MAMKTAQRTFYIRPQSNELNDRTFDQELLPQFFHLFHRKSLSSLERVIFDLRRVAWGNPYGAMGIVMMAEVLRDYSPWEMELWLTHPNQVRRQKTWLGHIGLPKAMEGLAKIEGELDDETDVAERFRFLPITALPANRSDQMRLLTKIAVSTNDLLVNEFHYDAVQAGRFITALSELCTNIYDHSSPLGDVHGFIAMQAYQDTVKFAVMDLGIGIPKSLRSQYEDLEDSQIIQKAFEPGVSARESEARGLGLARVAEIVKRQHGVFNIRSGRAKVLLLGRQGRREIFKLQQKATFPGTQIGILLRRVQSELKETP
jgi:anti-sigma regulatory factor (Ser/Thr protein kinase)